MNENKKDETYIVSWYGMDPDDMKIVQIDVCYNSTKECILKIISKKWSMLHEVFVVDKLLSDEALQAYGNLYPTLDECLLEAIKMTGQIEEYTKELGEYYADWIGRNGG